MLSIKDIYTQTHNNYTVFVSIKKKTPFGFGHSSCSVLWCALFLLDADTWSKEDCLTLLERIRSLLPDGDTMKYKTTESHFDWEKVGFGVFTGDMCKQKWQKVSTEVSQIPVS